MGYLSPEDWQEFARLFPEADNFIISKNLEGEFRHIASIPKAWRNPYQQARFRELYDLYINLSAIGGKLPSAVVGRSLDGEY